MYVKVYHVSNDLVETIFTITIMFVYKIISNLVTLNGMEIKKIVAKFLKIKLWGKIKTYDTKKKILKKKWMAVLCKI